MLHPENLRPPKTSEEAKERGRKGGIKSGEARRKKRTMKAAAELMLNLEIKQEHVKENVRNFGIDEEDSTNMMAMMARMMFEALSGNVKAAEFLRTTVGSDAAGLDRAERLKLEKERHKLEKLKMEMAGATEGNDGLPTILDFRPDEKDDRNG